MKYKLNLLLIFLLVYIGPPVFLWFSIKILHKAPLLSGVILCILGIIWTALSYIIARSITEVVVTHG